MPDHSTEVIAAIGEENVLAGRLYSHRRRGHESASFAYEAAYAARPDAYALEPGLPLVLGAQQTPLGLAMFRGFADASPDRWGRTLIARAERRRAEATDTTPRSLGEIDFLLGVRDDLRQGSVRFRDASTGTYLASDGIGVPKLTDLPALLRAAERLEEDDESAEELRELLRVGSSLGGARPKANVIDVDGQIAIAKFPSANHDTWNVMAWEKVALDLATRSGITAAHSRLLQIAARSVLIVTRFDRDRALRVGYLSAMTALEASDGDTGSYVDIAGAIEQMSPRASEDLRQMWRRIAFTILISNTDDHLRNHGFLRVGRDAWTLSPAFDLNPNPASGTKYLSTAIDETETLANISTLMSVAELFRLTEPEALSVLRDVADATKRWREAAESLGLSKAEITRMEPAFEHEAARNAAELTAI